MHKPVRYPLARWIGAALLPLVAITGCRSPAGFRHEADRAAYDIIAAKQAEALGRTEPFSIERPADTLRRRLLLDQHLPTSTSASLGTADLEAIRKWPDDEYLESTEGESSFSADRSAAETVTLTLLDALQIGAYESRDYQARKEQVYEAALSLDLERDAFRDTWAGVVDSLFSHDLEVELPIDDRGNTDRQRVSGTESGSTLDFTQRFKSGVVFTAGLGLDLVSLLTQERFSTRGAFADASITIPLLRGSGRFVVTEPLTQAERNVVYAIYTFERFKRTFVVRIAAEYLSVLQQLDQVQNAEENYRGLVTSSRRATRLEQAGGRLPGFQVDQAKQDTLRARSRWISARESYRRRIDAFKVSLGLPTDAAVELDRGELERLADAAASLLDEELESDAQEEVPPADAPVVLVEPDRAKAGPFELEVGAAIRLGLENRLDLRTEIGRIFDAQRSVAIAADRLRADLTLLGSGSAAERRTLGSGDAPNGNVRPDEGSYSALITLDLPLERLFERNAYRGSLIDLEQAVRSVQELEDRIKLDVRTGLSDLLEARESIRIQAQAVKLALRRVDSTNLLLEAGQAQIRDVLEAQEALISAQNAFTAALVSYRVGELALQRDLGVLQVDEKGLWEEYTP